MAVFSAYFDASGNRRMKAMAFAGFVSTVDKWDRFSKEWSAILCSYHVSSLHMTDFVSSKREYASWKGKTKSRKKFIKALVECIKKNTHKGFSCGTYLDDYNHINKTFMLEETMGPPYAFCGYSCLGGLERWAIRKSVNKSEILIAVEDGDENQGDLIELSRSDRFKVIPLPKSSTVAFQAADLIGWKNRTVLQDALRIRPKTAEEAEQILRSLEPLEGIVQNNGGFDKEALCLFCGKKNIPKR